MGGYQWLRFGLAFPLPPQDTQARAAHGGSDERQFAGGALVSDDVHHQQGRSDHGHQGCCDGRDSRERGFGWHGSAANEGAPFYRRFGRRVGCAMMVFVRARLQSCRKSCKSKAASAAEGHLFVLTRTPEPRSAPGSYNLYQNCPSGQFVSSQVIC
jgi:hypothetical protein